MTPNLKTVKRLAAEILRCGRNRVKLNPAETAAYTKATNRATIRRYINSQLIVRKSVKGQSRFRCNKYQAAKFNGRHSGLGKRKGSYNARNNVKRLWMIRQRVLRRVLRKLRHANRIDKHSYHSFYLKAKGNQFKNKRNLIDAIWNARNELNKERILEEQRNARLNKANSKRLRRQLLAEQEDN